MYGICKHPTYPKLIEAFRKEQRSMKVLYAQLRTVEIYPRKQESLDKDKLRFNLVVKYEKKS